MSSSVCAILRLDLRQRRWELWAAGAAVFACALVPWLIRDVGVSWQFMGSAAASAVTLVGCRRAGWLPGPLRITGLHRSNLPGWQVQCADGRIFDTELHPDCRVFRAFIWLRFHSRHTLLLGPGDLASEQWRRLRVVLRQQSSSTAPVGERVA
jgi:hypothetical protein